MSNIKVSQEEIERANNYYREVSFPYVLSIQKIIDNSGISYELVDEKFSQILEENELIVKIKETLSLIREDVDAKLSQGYFR